MDPGDPLGSIVRKWNHTFNQSLTASQRKKIENKKTEARDFKKAASRMRKLHDFMNAVGDRKKYKGDKWIGSEVSQSEVESYGDWIDEKCRIGLTKADIMRYTNKKPEIVTDHATLMALVTNQISRKDAIEILVDKYRIVAVICKMADVQGYSTKQIKHLGKNLYSSL